MANERKKRVTKRASGASVASVAGIAKVLGTKKTTTRPPYRLKKVKVNDLNIDLTLNYRWGGDTDVALNYLNSDAAKAIAVDIRNRGAVMDAIHVVEDNVGNLWVADGFTRSVFATGEDRAWSVKGTRDDGSKTFKRDGERKRRISEPVPAMLIDKDYLSYEACQTDEGRIRLAAIQRAENDLPSVEVDEVFELALVADVADSLGGMDNPAFKAYVQNMSFHTETGKTSSFFDAEGKPTTTARRVKLYYDASEGVRELWRRGTINWKSAEALRRTETRVDADGKEVEHKVSISTKEAEAVRRELVAKGAAYKTKSGYYHPDVVAQVAREVLDIAGAEGKKLSAPKKAPQPSSTQRHLDIDYLAQSAVVHDIFGEEAFPVNLDETEIDGETLRNIVNNYADCDTSHQMVGLMVSVGGTRYNGIRPLHDQAGQLVANVNDTFATYNSARWSHIGRAYLDAFVNARRKFLDIDTDESSVFDKELDASKDSPFFWTKVKVKVATETVAKTINASDPLADFSDFLIDLLDAFSKTTECAEFFGQESEEDQPLDSLEDEDVEDDDEFIDAEEE